MYLKLELVYLIGSLLLFQSCIGLTGEKQDGPHPLDPLTSTEITATSQIIRANRPGNFIFNYITLREPPKADLLPYFLSDTNPPPGTFPRKSFAVLLDRTARTAHEVVVNLDTQQVEEWVQLSNDFVPLLMLTGQELSMAEEVARADANVAERCQRLGFANTSYVNADSWSIGYVGDQPQYRGKRLAQLYFFGKNSPLDNQYTHPLDFIAVVDLLEEKVIAIEDIPIHDDADTSDRDGLVPPKAESNFDPRLRDPSKFKDVKPVKVTQAEGTSFNVTGNEITWLEYKMRVGFNGREGLVLYNLNFNDNDTVRPLFYRMSLGEMFVPYGDPRAPYHRKHVFDEGQYGMGFCTNSLKPNLDCIGEVKYIDAVLHDAQGQPIRIPRVVCIREVDEGILWKHTDERIGQSALVRNQRLCLTFIVTVGNYDYIFTWKFSMDGTIEYHVQLTGILSVNLLATGATPAGHGSIVFPNLNAQYHQHFFSLRLDAEIDGNQNTVTVTDVVPGPGIPGGPQNPYGQAWTTEKTVMTTAEEGRSNCAPEKSRVWIISNPNSINNYTNQPVGWKLMPFPSPPLLVQQQSPIYPVAAWADYHTWVTPYHEDQLFPGGLHTNASGLPEWVEKNPNENIENTDIVIWHNFGISHVPRIEDFPVMPFEQISIFLKPYNFFLENTALDIPPPVQRDNSEL